MNLGALQIQNCLKNQMTKNMILWCSRCVWSNGRSSEHFSSSCWIIMCTGVGRLV